MAKELTPGEKAPDFKLPTDSGGTVALADFRGQKLALYFYPRANTPGCTREAVAFSRLADSFAKMGTAVLGVSADPVAAQVAFKAEQKLKIALASDETLKMLAAYGAWGTKSMYGKTFMGIKRTTFLIGADGKIARIWNNVKVDGHARDVLVAAKAL